SLRLAQSGVIITATDLDPPYLSLGNSTSFQAAPSTAARIQVIVDGETAEPGNFTLARGVVNSPNPAQAGIGIPIEIRITDNFWNITNSSSSIRVTSSDPFDQSTGPWVGWGEDPKDVVVNNGVGNFTFPLITLSTTGWTLTAEDQDNNAAPDPLTYLSFTSTNIAVEAGTPQKLVTILPGEQIDQGAPTGKTGTVDVSTAGMEIDVNVYVTDFFHNIVTVPPALGGSNAGDVQISIENNTDPYAQISIAKKSITEATGLVVFQLTPIKAGTHTIAADDVTPAHGVPWTRSLSSELTVQPNDAKHLLTLMPGENPLPGSGAPGKFGSPQQQVSGASFTVTVQVVDDYYNFQPTHPDERVRIDTSDSYDI
ncbi:hypothetical protein BVX98_03405, partial [bacterium F11]